VSSLLTNALKDSGRRHSKIFIAWTKETEQTAEIICERLNKDGLSAWMSIHIEAGRRFRDEVRRSIQNADIVIAVLPKEPSRWLTAEAGLAYFEEKLLPVAIDEECFVEPFNALQTHILRSSDIEAGAGTSIDKLVSLIDRRLGFVQDNVFVATVIRLVNILFYFGIPVAGLLVVCALLVLALICQPSGINDIGSDVELHMWKAGHTVLGSIVYGGAAFIALMFARANTIRSLAGRHASFSTAQQMFVIWIMAALGQFAIGLYLLDVSEPFDRGHDWVFGSVVLYLSTLSLSLAGFVFHFASHKLNAQGDTFGQAGRYALLGNVFFSSGLVTLTIVLVLMSLRGDLNRG
jgi:hypothetical protein